MSASITCDRCGRVQGTQFISSQLADKTPWRRLGGLRFRFNREGGRHHWNRPDWERIDLCVDCSRDLDLFLSNEPVAVVGGDSDE